jgi:hypothetical protein
VGGTHEGRVKVWATNPNSGCLRHYEEAAGFIVKMNLNCVELPFVQAYPFKSSESTLHKRLLHRKYAQHFDIVVQHGLLTSSAHSMALEKKDAILQMCA